MTEPAVDFEKAIKEISAKGFGEVTAMVEIQDKKIVIYEIGSKEKKKPNIGTVTQ